jgi:hypothetical protein
VFIPPFIHSVVYSLTPSLILTPFTQFLTLSAIHSLLHPFHHLLTLSRPHPLHHLLTPSCPHPLNSSTDSCTQCLTIWTICWLACLLTRLDHDIMQYSLVDRYQCFRGTCCLLIKESDGSSTFPWNVTTALPYYDITSHMNLVLSIMCHRRNAGNSFVTVDRWWYCYF